MLREVARGQMGTLEELSMRCGKVLGGAAVEVGRGGRFWAGRGGVVH